MNPFSWETVTKLMADQMAFAIATIIGHEGSTPRTSGTKMIVTGDGMIFGTVGGGLLEARVMEKAVEIINGKKSSAFMPFDLSHEDVESMDMICGGCAEIFLDVILPSRENREFFQKWRRVSGTDQKVHLVTVVARGNSDAGRVCRGIIRGDKLVEGELSLPEDALDEICRVTTEASFAKIVTYENLLVILEPAMRPKAAFLFGAGHVAIPTAHLCALVGFDVTVLDDRDTFASVEHFPDADQVRVIDSFENAFDAVSVEDDSFIVIFTRGHLYDKTVLADALKTAAGYIGMIGSRKKRDATYKALMKTGFSQEDIDRVHSPIGLAIGAKSPAEIAVSIVAEMIQERDRMNHG